MELANGALKIELHGKKYSSFSRAAGSF